ncbi:hypothetical protein CsSME_00018749 [Camellia sinensis var. sinensis]
MLFKLIERENKIKQKIINLSLLVRYIYSNPKLPNTIYNNPRVPNLHYSSSKYSSHGREGLKENKKKKKKGLQTKKDFWVCGRSLSLFFLLFLFFILTLLLFSSLMERL